MNHRLNRRERLALRCAAELLRYPDAELDELLPDLWGRSNALCSPLREYLQSFMDGFERRGRDQMQAEHVRTFDLNSRTSLSMAWHRYGDDPRQGRAFAALNGLYRDAGLEPLPGELPDHLPRMLEFMSEAPEWACRVVLDGFGRQMLNLRQRLEEAQSAYAPVLKAVCDVLDAETPVRTLQALEARDNGTTLVLLIRGGRLPALK